MRLGETLGKAIDMCRSLAQGRDIFDTKIKWAVVGLALPTVARVTLVLYLSASVSTLVLPRLQYVGLLCWTTLGLWAVLLFVAARHNTHPEALTTEKTVIIIR